MERSPGDTNTEHPHIIQHISRILWNLEVPVAKLQICCEEYFKHAVLKVTWLLILCIIWQNLVVCWYPRINDLAELLNGRNLVCILAAVVYWNRRYPRLCVFAYEYSVFLGRVTRQTCERHDSPRSRRDALSKKCYGIHKTG